MIALAHSPRLWHQTSENSGFHIKLPYDVEDELPRNFIFCMTGITHNPKNIHRKPAPLTPSDTITETNHNQLNLLKWGSNPWPGGRRKSRRSAPTHRSQSYRQRFTSGQVYAGTLQGCWKTLWRLKGQCTVLIVSLINQRGTSGMDEECPSLCMRCSRQRTILVHFLQNPLSIANPLVWKCLMWRNFNDEHNGNNAWMCKTQRQWQCWICV